MPGSVVRRGGGGEGEGAAERKLGDILTFMPCVLIAAKSKVKIIVYFFHKEGVKMTWLAWHGVSTRR